MTKYFVAWKQKDNGEWTAESTCRDDYDNWSEWMYASQKALRSKPRPTYSEFYDTQLETDPRESLFY